MTRLNKIRLFASVGMTIVLLGGFLINVPKIPILEHTARNLYFHVPMWGVLLFGTGLSAFHSVRMIQKGRFLSDIKASSAAQTAFAFGIFGLLTGIFWSRFTWYTSAGLWWNNDPRQTMVVAGLLVYSAYFVLRNSIDDPEKRSKISAVYNLFAFATLPFLLYVVPRQLKSLHPGAEGNPAFSEITDPVMRMVFYPSVLCFIAIYLWLYSQRSRIAFLRSTLNEDISL